MASGERADSLSVQYRDEVARTSFMLHVVLFRRLFSGEGRTEGGSGSVQLVVPVHRTSQSTSVVTDDGIDESKAALTVWAGISAMGSYYTVSVVSCTGQQL